MRLHGLPPALVEAVLAYARDRGQTPKDAIAELVTLGLATVEFQRAAEASIEAARQAGADI